MMKIDGAKTDAPSFEDLLAPVSLAEFVNHQFQKTYCVFPGDPEPALALFDWDDMNQALNLDVWNSTNLSLAVDGKRAPPQIYCRQRRNHFGAAGMVPDANRVAELLRQGASMVLDDLGGVSPKVAKVCDDIRKAFNGLVGANLYFSQRDKPAFDAHFDRHEVFAIQIYGEKRWRIYEGRADAPIEHPMFQNIPPAQYDRMKGRVEEEILLTPGDLLYLPRGQMHDALAVTDTSVHITFSCVRPTGINLLKDMAQRMVERPIFRQDLPAPSPLDQDAALREHLKSLLVALEEAYCSEEGLAMTKRLLGGFTETGKAPFDLPNFERAAQPPAPVQSGR